MMIAAVALGLTALRLELDAARTLTVGGRPVIRNVPDKLSVSDVRRRRFLSAPEFAPRRRRGTIQLGTLECSRLLACARARRRLDGAGVAARAPATCRSTRSCCCSSCRARPRRCASRAAADRPRVPRVGARWARRRAAPPRRVGRPRGVRGRHDCALRRRRRRPVCARPLGGRGGRRPAAHLPPALAEGAAAVGRHLRLVHLGRLLLEGDSGGRAARPRRAARGERASRARSFWTTAGSP